LNYYGSLHFGPTGIDVPADANVLNLYLSLSENFTSHQAKEQPVVCRRAGERQTEFYNKVIAKYADLPRQLQFD